MMSHTGGLVTMGTGGTYFQYIKKKLNTKSSTEAKLVGVENILTQVIWTRYFLKDQGYDIHENFIYQDNQSAIKLENNGRWSSINRKRHINIINYFINDSITKQEASVEFCPTLKMIRDYSTKALQGSQFCWFGNIIIGIHEDEITSYNASGRALLEEQKLKLEK